ncbi:hypothetical protein MINS_27340 [Mycolicibacterium insubricum]|nr:hypothetical protein MINS_27340 [Mycolicibacterium insubricum]
MSGLRSDNPSIRLAAARELVGSDLSESIGTIRRIRRTESDSWVRAALDRAIAKWESDAGAASTGEGWITVPAAGDLEDIRADAIQDVTRTLLHEIRPLVGAVDSAARYEVGGDYQQSDTGRGLARLRELLGAIQTLHDAAAAPRIREFDLADLVVEEIAVQGFSGKQVLPTRTDPVVVGGDPDLLKLALGNALRNAVEASETTQTKVVVNCGATSQDAWVAVLDDGVGLPEASDRVWEPGITKKSKQKHFGWGLPIAQRAVHSFGGSIRLQPREHGGTVCEIRWSLHPKEVTTA